MSVKIHCDKCTEQTKNFISIFIDAVQYHYCSECGKIVVTAIKKVLFDLNSIESLPK
jgi:hypothetical protein